MKHRRISFLFLFFGILFAFLFSSLIDYSGETRIVAYDVGNYFGTVEKINGSLKISPMLSKAFEYKNVSEKNYVKCVKQIEKCNLLEGNCTISDLSSCLIKESVLNFNNVRAGGKPYACPNCPRSVKVRDEYKRGDFDKVLVEKIKKVETDDNKIKRCYILLKDTCLDSKCFVDMIYNNCLNSEDSEEYFRKYQTAFFTDEEFEFGINSLHNEN